MKRKPAHCQLCFQCALPPLVFSDAGRDPLTLVSKNLNLTGTMAVADMEAEGHK